MRLKLVGGINMKVYTFERGSDRKLESDALIINKKISIYGVLDIYSWFLL
jgi:hypothetical protein